MNFLVINRIEILKVLILVNPVDVEEPSSKNILTWICWAAAIENQGD